MNHYTRTEYLEINAGWKRLEDYAEIRGRMGELREIREILAEARREMGDQTEARGVLACRFIEALEVKSSINLASLWQMPRHSREMMAYAWNTESRDGLQDDEFNKAYAAMLTAADHHRAARRRLAGLASPLEVQS